MHNLYLRIYLTVVAVLLLFALVSGWVFKRSVENERESARVAWTERAGGWVNLIESNLPSPEAPTEEQETALRFWSERLRLPLALDDAGGRRIAQSESFARRGPMTADPDRVIRLELSDGRALWLLRPNVPPRHAMFREGDRAREPGPPWFFAPGVGLIGALVVLFIAIALGAYPVVRRLTRRLEALKRGVETFGRGDLAHRVDDRGRDEVAAVAASFNDAAARVQGLITANHSLLANASHELRSPLARLKMALSLLDADDGGLRGDGDAAVPERRARLKDEISRNVRELDELVEEVLLASRLGAAADARTEPTEPVDLLALAAEEGAPYDAQVQGEDLRVPGHERLLRRALRNLLENARRYGGSEPPEVSVRQQDGMVELEVADRGPGVPANERDRIFEPFYRLPGHAERAGGVGLGLSLVQQIAERHGGRAAVLPRAGGGSRFLMRWPLVPGSEVSRTASSHGVARPA